MSQLMWRTIILFSLLIGSCDLLGFWKKPNYQTQCSGNNNKLLSLLNLLCNTTQSTSTTTRDACYGCFFRAGNLPAGQTQLSTLNQCAGLYLTNTSYSACVTVLQNSVNNVYTTPSPYGLQCYAGHCDFVRCVRRINANLLIDQCLVTNLVNRDMTVAANRIYFYTNTTSCILARTRCNAYNPITGELQNLGQPQGDVQYPSSSFNSLQIAPNGDIRVVAFPTNVVVAEYFCSTRTSLEQANYGDAIC